MGIARFIHRLS